ncbi:MAG: efflux RND transporter periplasmic adaptor subunit [Planctomycetota bacterium]
MKTHGSSRRGGSAVIVVSAIFLIAALGAGALIVRSSLTPTDNGTLSDEHVARRGSFEISVPASGELAALKQIEIRNKLEYRAVVASIVDEGTYVQAGDILVSFASDEIENKIKDADDALNSAETQLIAAQSNLEIRISSNLSEMDRANLSVNLAELALRAWQEGDDISKKKSLDLAIETAEINHDRLVDRYEEAKELVKQEFISQDEFKRDEIAKIEAWAKLEQVKLDKRIYLEYLYEQAKKQKESDVDQAIAERKRIQKRHEAQELTAAREVESKQHQLQSRTERLADLEEQLELCKVRAPAEGLVVYASSLEEHRWSRMNRDELQPGTEVRKNDLLMILPDTSTMTAEVKVNESRSGLIKPGQRAMITSDAVPDVALEGEVLEIGVLAESGGWRDPNRRDYTVTIKLSDGNAFGLKPSMRCKSEIYVGQVDDVIHVPLQAVFRAGPAAFVYVPRGAGFAQQRVQIGQTSGLYAEIPVGLEEGETVLLREPKPREIVARLTDAAPTEGEATPGQRQPGQAALGADKSWSGNEKGRRPRRGERSKGPA